MQDGHLQGLFADVRHMRCTLVHQVLEALRFVSTGNMQRVLLSLCSQRLIREKETCKNNKVYFDFFTQVDFFLTQVICVSVSMSDDLWTYYSVR